MGLGRIIRPFVAILSICGMGFALEVEPQAVIPGTAFYRERIALPPEAVFEAQVVDISDAGAPADVLGRVRLESPGQAPIRFEIPYDASRVQEGRRYGVRASITVGGRPWFTTDRIYPVLTAGHGDRVELLLTRASTSPRADGGREAVGLGTLPASFAGDLPSADGPRIRYHLDLLPGRVFVLRMIKIGREGDPPFDQIGTWLVSADGRLMLESVGRAPILFSIRDRRTLHMLDRAMWEIEPKSSYNLHRLEPFAPIEPRLLLRGMYGNTPDAVFQECLTGWRLPVVPEGDHAALESAYANARPEPGEPLFVTLLGRIVHRPGMQGADTQMALVPERFIGVWPGESCGPHPPRAARANARGEANARDALPPPPSE